MADQTQNDAGGQRNASELLAEHAEATPLVQTSSSIPQPRRLTRRELARRRRQRLLELLQPQGKPPEERTL